ncbi:hypothetical protein [Microbacterium lacticum]|uniref:hypothetical protein n=1 Tax=Microbacterium lacticum TaxID=33885 RepID=UPI001F56F24F|nr:hypothetical protein [Microbacterium lacticum]
MDHLPIPHAENRVPAEPELGIVGDVALRLPPDMGAAIDLEHETVTDQQADAVTVEPDLPTAR